MNSPNTSFISRGGGPRNEDSQVVELLIASAEFAAFAMDRLIRQYDDEGEELRKIYYDYAALTHTLEVTFLFPNITGAEREVLARLQGARNSLMVGLSGNRQWRTEEQRLEHEKTLGKLSNQFVVLKSEVINSRLRERVSGLQRKLLDREFLSLPGATSKGAVTG